MTTSGRPVSTCSGSRVSPGSKSITNRALLIAALAEGESHLVGALFSDDTRYMGEALRQLESEGLIEVIAHKGPVIATISKDQAEGIYQLREILEGLVTENADLVKQAADQLREFGRIRRGCGS